MKLFDYLKQRLSRSEAQIGRDLASEFHRRFGYKFRNDKLLIEALTHRSFVYHAKNGIASNERLEYLGDSVLGLIVADHLFHSHPHFAEGNLTKMKSILVNELTLSKVGEECELNRLILISPEEEKSGGRERSSIVSDAVEAVIGAIFLDSGLDAAREFVKKMIISQAQDLISDSSQRNYKGELLEYLQSRGEGPPYYEVVSEEGPDHEKTFTIVVQAGGRIMGRGIGASKKEAEQQAAAVTLEALRRESEKKEGQ